MKLASIRIFVRDLEEAARFYETVIGLKESWRSDQAIGYGENPVMILELADAEAHDEKLVGRFSGIAFLTDDARALFEDFTATGLKTEGAPERQYWGGILVHASDPSGNIISFVQQ